MVQLSEKGKRSKGCKQRGNVAWADLGGKTRLDAGRPEHENYRRFIIQGRAAVASRILAGNAPAGGWLVAGDSYSRCANRQWTMGYAEWSSICGVDSMKLFAAGLTSAAGWHVPRYSEGVRHREVTSPTAGGTPLARPRSNGGRAT